MGKNKPSNAGGSEAKAPKVASAVQPTSIVVHIGVGALCFGLGSWSPWTSGMPPAVATQEEPHKAEQKVDRLDVADRAQADDPWAITTHPDMGRDGFNWTQLSMSRTGNFPLGGIKSLTAEMVRQRGQMWVHHTVFARSIPGLVSGLADNLARKIGSWGLADFRRELGALPVVAAYSPDRRYNFGMMDEEYGRVLLQPARTRVQFSTYLDEVEADARRAAEGRAPDEYVSIQQ